jgi:hypothetical protein
MTEQELQERIKNNLSPMLANALEAIFHLATQELEEDVVVALLISPRVQDAQERVIVLSMEIDQHQADMWAEKIKDAPKMQDQVMEAERGKLN